MALYDYIISRSAALTPYILIFLILRCVFKHIPKKYFYFLWIITFVSLMINITIPLKINEKSIINNAISQPQENIAEEFNDKSDNLFLSDENQNMSDLYYKNQFEIKKYFPFIWMVGVVVLIANQIKGFINVYSLKKYNCDCNDGICYNPYVKTPFVLGFLNPVIYMPVNTEKSEAEYILKHEKIHIKRLDYIIKPVCMIITAIHWFNPLVWILYSVMSKDTELSCDEAVVENLDTKGKKEYCSALLSYALKNQKSDFGTVLFSQGGCGVRIKNILTVKKLNRFASLIITITVFMAGCSTAIDTQTVYSDDTEMSQTFSENEQTEDIEDSTQILEEKDNIQKKAVDFPFESRDGIRVSRVFTGQYPDHSGVDFVALYGTPIISVNSGTVTEVGYIDDEGNYVISKTGQEDTVNEGVSMDGLYVIITDENGLSMKYSHCSQVCVRLGDEVSASDVIAKVGSTGNSTGNHLHFEVINSDGENVDPEQYIKII